MVRYKVKTGYVAREALLHLLKKKHPDISDSDFRIVVSLLAGRVLRYWSDEDH